MSKRNLNSLNFNRMSPYHETCSLKRNMEYIYILIKVKYLQSINSNRKYIFIFYYPVYMH